MNRHTLKLTFFITLGIIALGYGGYFYTQYKHEHRFDGLLVCQNLSLIDDNTTFTPLVPIDTKSFYEQSCKKSDTLPWFNNDLVLNPEARELILAIEESSHHGLFFKKYHLETLEKLIKEYELGIPYESMQEQAKKANLIDIHLSDAFLAITYDIHYGLTNWKKYKNLHHRAAKEEVKKETEEKKLKYLEQNLTIEDIEDTPIQKFEWEKPKKQEIDRIRLLIDGLENKTIYTTIDSLHPQHKEYKKLLKVLAHLQKEPMKNKDLIDKIILNLERFRWITTPYDSAPKAITINIPAYTLELLENGEKVWDMRVIVGKPKRPTPILESNLSYAILNPYWTAPDTIIREDILKKGESMGEYLKSHNMRLFIKENNKKRPIDPDDINWTLYKDAKRTPFVFRAEPGSDNPLGAVKFTFPNKYSVFMHDTDKKQFFSEPMRAFSSGCVRLNEPQKLFYYLLGEENNDTNLSRFNKHNKPEHPINLKTTIPVVFRYMTVVPTSDTQVIMYEDIYKYDLLNMEAMRDSENLFYFKKE